MLLEGYGRVIGAQDPVIDALRVRDEFRIRVRDQGLESGLWEGGSCEEKNSGSNGNIDA